MTDTATLSSKFQISIPKAVRTQQRWIAGQVFAFIPKGTGVLLVPAPDAKALKGSVPNGDSSNYRDRSDRA